MHSSRNLILLVITLIALAGAIAWQLIGDSTLPQLPNSAPAQQSAEDTDTQKAQAKEGSEKASTANAGETVLERQSVQQQNPASSDLPSIIGQIVGVNGIPARDIEVTCTPGRGMGSGMMNADSDFEAPVDFDMTSPQAWMNLARGNSKDRVVVLSDENGNFRIRQEGTSKNLRLRVRSRGHLIIEKNAARPTDRDVDVGVMQLAAGAIVTGRVVDAVGNSVAGAIVTCATDSEQGQMPGMDFDWPGREMFEQSRNNDIQETDADGRFAFNHAPAGKISIRATHNDHPNVERKGLSVAMGNTLADILITMPRSGTIRGVVSELPEDLTGLRVMGRKKQKPSTDGESGILGMLRNGADMMEEMDFAIGEAQCEINNDGSFTLRGLDADSLYRIWVGKQGRGFAGSNRSSERIDARTDSNGVKLRYEAGVSVSFIVVDSKSGAPVESLWVRDVMRGGGGFGDMLAFAPSTATNKPYPEGKVTVANLRPKKKQSLQLTINAIGYDSYEQKDIELPAEGNLDLGTLRLDPQPTIQVTVLSAYQSKAINGAKVSLTSERGRRGDRFAAMTQMGARRSSPRSATTDEDGKCIVNALIDQPAELKVTKRGYAPASIPVLQKGEESSEQIVRLIVGGKVIVTVLDQDQQPLNNVRVEHRTPEGTTDDQRTDKTGTAQFTNLTTDLHEFRLAAPRDAGNFMLQFQRGRGDRTDGEPWQAIDVQDQETARVELTKSPTASITGFVRENGVALTDAMVSFKKGQGNSNDDPLERIGFGAIMGTMNRGGSSGRSESADDGAYSLKNLPAGDHTLRITHKSRAMPTNVLVTLIDGENRILDIDLITTTLRGIVQDVNGKPVAGADVTVAAKPDETGANAAAIARQVSGAISGLMRGMGQSSGKLTTNANGEFELRGVAADVELEVKATASGLSPASTTTTVALGQTKGPITLTMTPSGRIEIKLTKSQMFAAIQAELVGEYAETMEPVVTMIRGKTGSIEGLRPGTWEITLMGMGMGRPDENSAPKQTVNVIANQTTTVTF